jgi:hypothetical protein
VLKEALTEAAKRTTKSLFAIKAAVQGGQTRVGMFFVRFLMTFFVLRFFFSSLFCLSVALNSS